MAAPPWGGPAAALAPSLFFSCISIALRGHSATHMPQPLQNTVSTT
jgi:hypothetical protein